MTTSPWDDIKNPARFPALHHAAARASREGRAMCVYTREAEAGPNTWFVRPEGDPPPAGAALVKTVLPGNQTYSQA